MVRTPYLSASEAQVVPGSSAALRRRSKVLVSATIAWNVVEAVIAITAGVAAGSAALVGFGLDSTVEVSAAVVAIWYLSGEAGEHADREQRASRLIALTFFALAAYVTFDAVGDLAASSEPETSFVGIVLTALSVVVMPALAIAKRRTAQRLGSRALVAEASQTAVCAYLSVAVLAGLVLNATVGWSWADPVAALVIAAIATREGVTAWRGEREECC